MNWVTRKISDGRYERTHFIMRFLSSPSPQMKHFSEPNALYLMKGRLLNFPGVRKILSLALSKIQMFLKSLLI